MLRVRRAPTSLSRFLAFFACLRHQIANRAGNETESAARVLLRPEDNQDETFMDIERAFAHWLKSLCGTMASISLLALVLRQRENLT